MNCIKLLSRIKRPFTSKIFSARYISQHPIKFLETQNKWRENDGISKQYQLIYKAPMENLLKYATAYLTFSTVAVGGLGAYYAAFLINKTDMNQPVVIGEDIVIANSAMECLTYLGAFVVFHVAVKVVLSKYVVRLYQNEEKYIAVFRGHWFNSVQKHEFKKNEVKKIKRSLIITWSDSVYTFGSKKAIILENYFKTPEYFNNFMSPNKDESNP